MRLNLRTKAMLAAATIAAAATVALTGCGTRGTVVAGGQFGATSTGAVKRPRTHEGVDFAIARGAEIIAPADGTVMLAVHTVERSDRTRWRCGPEILIHHTGRAAGITTRYCHLGTLYVHFGDTVREGDVIATVGVCGKGSHECVDHLHFETVDSYIRKDPRSLLVGCFSDKDSPPTDERPLWHPLKC